MLVRRLLILGVALAALVAMATAVQAQSFFLVTGGGQHLTEPEDDAEDTLTFEARDASDEEDGFAATGEVEFDPTDGPTAVAEDRFHGRVTCLRVEGNMAIIGGEKDPASSQGETDLFEIYLVDNSPEDDDLITLDESEDADCDSDPTAEQELFRGVDWDIESRQLHCENGSGTLSKLEQPFRARASSVLVSHSTELLPAETALFRELNRLNDG